MVAVTRPAAGDARKERPGVGARRFTETGVVPEPSRVVKLDVTAGPGTPAPRPPSRGRAPSPPKKTATPAAPPRSTAALAAAAVLAACWFRPAFPPAHVALRGRAFAPPVATKLSIVGSRLKRVAWKRDGGFSLEAAVTMRMFNDKPVPLKLRSLNTTVLLRSLGSSVRYAAGYQAATRISLPPKGHADVPATLVLRDLRPLMLPALFVDVAAAAWAAVRGGPPVLEVPLEGVIKLWPAGRVDVACTMEKPLVGAIVTNRCRAKLF